MKKSYFLLLALTISTFGFAQDNDSDITIGTPPFPITQNIDYSTKVAPSGLNFGNSVLIGAFDINDLGTSDGLGTILTSVEFSITNSENIAAIALYDFFTPLLEVTTINPTTNFTGFSLTANDGASKQFLVLATFKTTVTDNEQIQLTISNTTTDPAGSSFVTPDAGGAATSIAGDDNRIEVTATQFQFDQQPTDGNELEVMAPFPTLFAVDANLNQDLDTNISGINVTSSGSLAAETYDMTNGQAILNNVVFSSTETGVTLIATSTSPSYTDTSNSFNINGPLVNIAQQDFDSSTGWAYTSDTAFFGVVGDWADSTEGYYNEIALTDASPLSNSLFSNEIFGENFLNEGGTPAFAILTFADTNVSSFTDLSILFDWQVNGYTDDDNDIEYRIAVDGAAFAGAWTSVFDGNGSLDNEEGRIKIDITDGTDSVALQLRLRNNLAEGYSGFDNFRIVSEFSGLVYTNSGGWKDNVTPDGTTGAQNVLIIDGTYNVSGNVVVNDLLSQSSATTNIPVGQSVTLNGNLINEGTIVLESSSDTYSSLIVNGTSVGEVTYNRHVNQFESTPGATTGNNDLISPPVTNADQDFATLFIANPVIPTGDIGGTASFLFGPFNNNTDEFINFTAANNLDPIEPGIGYRTASTTTGGSNFSFVGDVETSASSVAITVGTTSDFNLIGNPYPSYISLSGFLTANNGEFGATNSGVYGYPGSVTDGYTVWNQAVSDANPGLLISPGQGFFVSSQVGGGSISFPSSIRTTGTSDDFIPGRNPNPVPLNAFLKLKLSSDELSSQTSIYFNENASLGLDHGYDAARFKEVLPNDFTVYSHLVEENTGIAMNTQSVSYDAIEAVTIPIGINAQQGEQIRVSISETNLPSDVNVYFEDNVNNTFTLLNSNDYIITPNVDLTETGRFFLTFSRSVLSTTENVLNGLEIYTNDSPKQIVIKGRLENGTIIQLYDIQGRIVNKHILNAIDTKHNIDVSSLSAGIYVVHINNTTGNKKQKVIIK